MTGPIIRTCSPDPEGRAEILCELRTEKPWQGDEGPGFNSRQLHREAPEKSGAFSMQWLFDLRILSCGIEGSQSRSGLGASYMAWAAHRIPPSGAELLACSAAKRRKIRPVLGIWHCWWGWTTLIQVAAR